MNFLRNLTGCKYFLLATNLYFHYYMQHLMQDEPSFCERVIVGILFLVFLFWLHNRFWIFDLFSGDFFFRHLRWNADDKKKKKMSWINKQLANFLYITWWLMFSVSVAIYVCVCVCVCVCIYIFIDICINIHSFVALNWPITASPFAPSGDA